MNGNDAPSDHTVTPGPVAGETIKDAARWPGYLLIAVSLLAFALSLTALASGNGTAAALGGVVVAVTLAAGIAWQILERRRVRRRLASGTPERPEDVGPLHTDV